MSTPAVIFDIDGTLANLSHRRHHVAGGKRDWGAFFALMGADTLIEPVARLYGALRRDGEAIVLCSGRPENYREITESWMHAHEIEGYENLYMRPAGDTRRDSIVKAEMLAIMRRDGFEPWLVIDDRPTVVAMWREQGLTCLQAAAWDEDDESGRPGTLSLMVGPSGAGKSTWLKSGEAAGFGIQPGHVISSDDLRTEICGDFRDQTRNAEVFAALHALARARIRSGLNAVVDATNLRRKDRLAVADLAPAHAAIRYFVIDRPMEEKRRDAGWRAELQIDLLAKHEQTFRSQERDILSGDGLPNVSVIDLRASQRVAA